MSLIFADPLFAPSLGDAEVAPLWGAEAQLACWIRFEAAHARVLGAWGLTDPAMAERAARAIEAIEIDRRTLAEGTARDGLPIPALVRQLKASAGADADAVHRGATSQDVMDTALALTAQATNDVLVRRIAELATKLEVLDARFGIAPLMGRTRMQAALEIRASDRIGAWMRCLADAGARFEAARPGIERVQLGGPIGDRRGFGDDPQGVADALADVLGLGRASVWHANRIGVVAYASALSLLTGALGKIGQDIVLMAQAGEIALADGGGSSAMPHKNNPVRAELLVSLGRFNAAQTGGLHQALVHEQERSGAAWALEWLLLPGLAIAAASALRLGCETLASIARIGEANA